jgi:hypothetical protein
MAPFKTRNYGFPIYALSPQIYPTTPGGIVFFLSQFSCAFPLLHFFSVGTSLHYSNQFLHFLCKSTQQVQLELCSYSHHSLLLSISFISSLLEQPYTVLPNSYESATQMLELSFSSFSPLFFFLCKQHSSMRPSSSLFILPFLPLYSSFLFFLRLFFSLPSILHLPL